MAGPETHQEYLLTEFPELADAFNLYELLGMTKDELQVFAISSSQIGTIGNPIIDEIT